MTLDTELKASDAIAATMKNTVDLKTARIAKLEGQMAVLSKKLDEAQQDIARRKKDMAWAIMCFRGKRRSAVGNKFAAAASG